MVDMVDGGRIDIAELAQRQDLPDGHSVKSLALLGEGCQEGWRFADTGGHADEVTVLHQTHRVCRAHPFALVDPLVNVRHARSFAVDG